MLVVLTSLSSLQAAFQSPPQDPEAAKELFWEARVFRKAVAAVTAHDASNADAATAAELLGLAGEVADLIVRTSGRLQPPVEGGQAAAGAAVEDAVRMQATTSAAACEVAGGLLGLLQLPFLHDDGIARRLAASAAAAVRFGVPTAAAERGLAGSLEFETVAGAALCAVELAAAAHTAPHPPPATTWLCPVVCRPGVLHGFLARAAQAVQNGAAHAGAQGERDWQRVRQRLALTTHLVLTAEPFQHEAERLLGDTPLLGRLLTEVTAWHAVEDRHATAGEVCGVRGSRSHSPQGAGGAGPGVGTSSGAAATAAARLSGGRRAGSPEQSHGGLGSLEDLARQESSATWATSLTTLSGSRLGEEDSGGRGWSSGAVGHSGAPSGAPSVGGHTAGSGSG